MSDGFFFDFDKGRFLPASDEAALIGYIKGQLIRYPQVAGEIRRFLDNQVETLSSASLGACALSPTNG